MITIWFKKKEITRMTIENYKLVTTKLPCRSPTLKKDILKFIAYKESPRNGLKAISTSYVSVVIENDNNLYALGSNMFEIKDDYLAKHFQEMIDLFYKKN